MMRWHALLLSLMSVATATTPAPTPAPKDALNVLFILFDDLRPNSQAYGLEEPSMPNLDAFAKRSTTFFRAHCNQAVCGPSRASLLSGRRPDTTQMWNFVGSFRDTPGAKDWRTWPQYFRTKGWTAYGVGKLFHNGDPKHFDEGLSWDYWGGFHGYGQCPNVTAWEASNPRHGCAIPAGADLSKQPDELTLSGAKLYLAQAKQDWVERGKPFWLGVGFVRPHMPQVFPEKYLSQVPALETLAVAKNQSNPTGTSAIEWGSGAEESGWQSPFPEHIQREYRRGYYAAAAYGDALMGELLQELKLQGLENDTLVVMSSDHGWGLGEHNHWIKYTNWETDTRVPLLIHHPKRPKTWGQKQMALVEHVDLYPTTAELAGALVDASEESIDGSSYAALFDKAEPVVEAPEATGAFGAAYTQYPRCNNGTAPYDFTQNMRCAYVAKENFTYMGYTLRTAEWRYTEWALWNGSKLKPEWEKSVPSFGSELYDHRKDNGMGTSAFDDTENENLAFLPENSDLVAKLSRQLRSFFATKSTSPTYLV